MLVILPHHALASAAMASAYSLVLASDDPTLQTLCDQIDGKAVLETLQQWQQVLGHAQSEQILWQLQLDI